MSLKDVKDDEFGVGRYLIGFMVLGFFVMMFI